MRPVEQLTVWRVPLFKADFYCKPLHRLKRVDVLCNSDKDSKWGQNVGWGFTSTWGLLGINAH